MVLNSSPRTPLYHLTHYYVIRPFVRRNLFDNPMAIRSEDDFQGGNKNSAGYFIVSLSLLSEFYFKTFNQAFKTLKTCL